MEQLNDLLNRDPEADLDQVSRDEVVAIWADNQHMSGQIVDMQDQIIHLLRE